MRVPFLLVIAERGGKRYDNPMLVLL